jgi:uncharacterized membrane protein YqaE (UPF0057 family)|tara:strand:- start:1146 stop:1829 length:684 start_codon:yes stop_codon:yes gene_type:complete
MKKTLLSVLAISIIASCNTSNEFVSNKLFQKRKYQKGWHVNSSKKIDRTKKEELIGYEKELVTKNEFTIENTVEPKSNSETKIKENSTSKEVVKEQITEYKSLSGNSIVNKSERPSSNQVQSIEKSTDLVSHTFETDKIEIQPTRVKKANDSSNSSGDASMILLIILCVFPSPLAVGLLRGWSSRELLISLILFVLAFGGIALIGGLGSIAFIVGIVYALLILFDII